MPPTVLRDGSFRLFFFSREEERVHVHVAHHDGEARFWVESDMELAVSIGLSSGQIADAEDAARRHQELIHHAWTDMRLGKLAYPHHIHKIGSSGISGRGRSYLEEEVDVVPEAVGHALENFDLVVDALKNAGVQRIAAV